MASKSQRPTVPRFASEAEEAKWWDDRRNMVEEEIVKAMRDGRVQTGTAQQLGRQAKTSKNITIRMPVLDIERARRLAEQKGLGYQTYMKMLLHQALNREESDTKPRSARHQTR